MTNGNQWIDLSRIMHAGDPTPATHGRLQVTVDHHQIGEVHGRVTHLQMAAHVGTHVDAASHFLPEGSNIDEYPLEHFIGAGVALDLRREGPVEITVADLEAARPRVQDNDIVLINTGYSARTDEDSVRFHPYLGAPAAEWLVSHHVRILGIDVVTPDMASGIREGAFTWPVHHTLFRNNCLIIENLGPRLDEVTGHRLEIIAAPLRFAGSDGAPVVPLARIVD